MTIRGLVLALGGLLGCLLGFQGCRSHGPAARLAPLPASSDELYGAWSAERRGEVVDALELASLATETPSWAAPSRFYDEYVRRGDLTLPERYGRYLTLASDVERAPQERASYFYLAGRLGGEAGERRLVRAAELDPRLGWAWHGIGWRSFSRGNVRRAIASGERAVRSARGGHELAHFASALARYMAQDQRSRGAQEVLAAALAAEDERALRPDEVDKLDAELAGIELDSLAPVDVRRGAQRALRVLRRPGLTLSERLQLVMDLRGRPLNEGVVAEEEVAYALVMGAERMGLDLSKTASERRAAALRLADGLFGETNPASAASPRTTRSSGGNAAETQANERVAVFAQPLATGEAQRELLRWRRNLPDVLRDDQGKLRRPELRALYGEIEAATARAAESAEGARYLDAATLQAVGSALMRAGWFREARALAEGELQRLSSEDPAHALARQLQTDALRARALLAALGALARRIDAREAFLNAGAVGTAPLESVEGGRVESLRELETEIVSLFRRYGAPGTPEDVVSPFIHYGPLGRIVHPGPAFSSEDEAVGRGAAGEPVPGLASLFGRMGRFALLGMGVGQGGPDATVLRVVGVEQRAGEHLGRPFRGTVFWCDGADVPGRYGRLGASISGAALHEGYYVDLSMIRLEEAQWDRLRTRFVGDASAIRRALDAPGAAVPRSFRAEVTPALGAADRMRLAVMKGERADSDGALTPMSLKRLAHVVAVHEEGHLCDRASWYPLSLGRIFRLIGFAGAHGFRGGRIGQALEERAQLVALCEVEDPRLAWIDLLDAAESSGGSVTPHAAAYRRLLGDLLDRLDDEFDAGDWEDCGLDGGVRWIDQLHRVDAQKLRALAIREAKARGVG